MTLTLDIPADLDAAQRERLAFTLYDVHALSAEQAAALAGLPSTDFLSSVASNDIDASTAESIKREQSEGVLRQGSPEWKALLRSIGEGRTGVVLPLEATSRENLYEDDLR